MNRRELLKLLHSGMVATAASSAFPLLASAAGRNDRPVALLVPLTGEQARLGHSMQQAALLAESAEFLRAYDTGGTAAGAAAAATAAIRGGARILLGPLTAAEVPAVAATVAGRIPMIAFSNDAVLRAPNVFLFGITAGQATSAILRYARGRGVRSVAVVEDGSPWSVACAAEAHRLEGELALETRVLAGEVPGQMPAQISGDVAALAESVDAVLIPGGGEAALRIARALKGSGIQVLATFQAVDNRPAALDALDGAWIASPSPEEFGRFASEFEARNGGRAGTITALAYDAANIARNLRTAETLTARGLLDSAGFRCVTGPVRFRTDGSVARDFAILVAGQGSYQVVGVSSGA